MTTIYLDLETMPDQRDDARQEFIDHAQDNFKAPSGITKSQMGIDLGIAEKDYKFISAGDLKLAWVDQKGPELYEQQGIDAWRNTALSPDAGQIFSICWAGETTPHGSYRPPRQSESELLEQVFTEIDDEVGNSGGMRQIYFVGHNIQFDLGFLWKRAIILGVKPPFKLHWDGRHGKDFYCTMQAWAGFKNRISQDNLCKILDIELKPDGIDGSKVWDFIERGEFQQVWDYNVHDVETVRRIYNRLNFL
jgi:hypothetical protein